MKKNTFKYFALFLFITTSFFTNNIQAQEKKIFLQSRFNGFSETITKDFTKKNLKDLKDNLERQGLYFSYKNLKYNQQKEIIKITISVKNKRSKSEVTFNDNGKPIPNIKVGESDGIATATKSSAAEFIFSDVDSKKIKFKSKNNKKPIYIVDGKTISSNKFNTIDTKNIESISVLKGKSAIKLYGDKGKNGVILIKMKQ